MRLTFYLDENGDKSSCQNTAGDKEPMAIPAPGPNSVVLAPTNTQNVATESHKKPPGDPLSGGDGDSEGLPVASCVSRDYTLTVRSLRATAGRRAAQCEERRRIEAGKQMLKVRLEFLCSKICYG